MPRDAVAPAVDTGGTAEFSCEVEGCGVTKGTRAALGVHRWNAHKLRGTGKNAKSKTKSPGSGSPVTGTATQPKPPSPARTPDKPTGRRKDGTKVCGGAWKLAVKYLVPKVSPNAAYVMTWQSAYAGQVLDAAVAHTRIDRMIVQRAAGKGANLTAVAGLFLLPGAVIACERQPALAFDPTFQEVLRGVVQANFEQLLDGKIKEQKEVANLEAKAAEAGQDYWATDANGAFIYDERGRQVSLVDGLVADILGMVVQQPQAQGATV